MALNRTNRGTKSRSKTTTSANTLVSGSFSPAAGALLVVLYDEITSDSGHGLVITDSFAGTGAWTIRKSAIVDGFGSYSVVAIAYATCGASPGTGQVTATRDAGSFTVGTFAEFIEISGSDASTPVPRWVANDGSGGTTLALNLASAPDAASMLFTACQDGGNSKPGVPSGFTELGSFNMDGGDWYVCHGEDLASGAQNNSWQSLDFFVYNGVLIEVAPAVDIDADAAAASATATANAASTRIATTAASSSATAAAGQAAASLGVSAETASSALSAPDATADAASTETNVPADTASVSAEAPDATSAVTAHATAAAAAATAEDTAAGIGASAGTATAVGTAAQGTSDVVEPPIVFVYQASDTELLDLTVSQRAEGFRFELLDSALNKIGDLYPQEWARIENGTTNAIKRRMNLRIPPDQYDDVNVLRDRVKPYMVLENGSEYPLGVFMFADGSSPEWSFGKVNDASLFDQGLILGQQLRRPIGFEAGALVTDCMRQVAEIGGINAALLDSSSAVLGSPLSWLAGGSETYASILEQLAKIAGFYSPYFDRNGLLTGRTAIDPNTYYPSLIYAENGRIIAGTIVRSNDLLAAPNVYVVYDNSATGQPVLAEYELPDEAPHSIANRGFAVPKIVEAAGIGTVDQALALAKQMAQTEAKAYETVNYQSATDPRHDTFDVLRFLDDLYIETAWAITCKPGGPMEHEIKRVYVQ